MKTIFITGASSGLGKATAKLFASNGWNVIATMRSPEKDSELADFKNIALIALDVTRPEQIASAVKRAISLHPIDVVFNNAGYGLAGALESYTDDQITRQINTNVLGVIRVTQAFLPHLREKKSGMIITTTSIGGHVAFPLSSLYHATKWALEGWSESMSFELALHNLMIKTVAPGGITTDFMGRSLDVGQHEAYTPLLTKLMAGLEGEHGALQFSPPERIADVVYEAATDGKDQLRYLAGKDAVTTYAARLAAGAEEFRRGVAAQFKV